MKGRKREIQGERERGTEALGELSALNGRQTNDTRLGSEGRAPGADSLGVRQACLPASRGVPLKLGTGAPGCCRTGGTDSCPVGPTHGRARFQILGLHVPSRNLVVSREATAQPTDCPLGRLLAGAGQGEVAALGTAAALFQSKGPECRRPRVFTCGGSLLRRFWKLLRQ